MNAIEAKNIFYSYTNDGIETKILNNLSLTIKSGELVAIQGPSGSGKSTLLYILGLLTTPNSGVIKIEENSLAELSADSLAHFRSQKIGFIFQQFHLLPKTSVIDNILLPTQYANLNIDSSELYNKACLYANLVGLGNHLHNLSNQLSGGQQQRVAICRALMNNPNIILADEPTGNLDSVSALQILELLQQLNRDLKKTIIIITHDNEVAKKCDRIIQIKDGTIENQEKNFEHDNQLNSQFRKQSLFLKKNNYFSILTDFFTSIKKSLPTALKNLNRNKTRTALTMIGISVGVAAVLSMITLGQFTKTKILSGYADLGVNTIVFYGYPNWQQKATDINPAPFRFFDWDRDLVSLKGVFPEIMRMSPVLMGWDGAADFGGKSIEQDVRVLGASEDALAMSHRKLLMGRNFSLAEIEQKSGVCIIGYEIAERLFSNTQPLSAVLKVTQGNNSYGCRIIGVLASTTSNKEYIKPNLQIFVPFTFYQAQAGDWWSSQIKEVMLQGEKGADIEKLSKGIRTFFEQKYGSSGRFRADSDSLLIAQMRRFLSLFTILLSSIALVTLAVGGIGITNMMLVSVSERFREIGLRKALGATDRQIRFQFITESMIVCLLAGFLGLVVGMISYNLAIWGASKFVSKLSYEWTFDWFAFLLSLISILLVGLLSGIFPAIKAEKLQVIEALRSE